MKVLLAASECAPYAKVGGLADVIAALPKELAHQQIEVDIVLPLYEHLLKEKLQQQIVDDTGNGNKFVVHFLGKDHTCRLFYLQIPQTPIKLFLIQNDTYLSNGKIYLSASAFAEGDEELARFMFFSKAVYTLMERGAFAYDAIHAHDYHTSYLLYLIKNEKALGVRPKLVLSIHNIANKGIVLDANLNKEINGWPEPHNLISLGIASSDVIVPVSPHYAQELSEGKFCYGMENVVRAFSDRFKGIVNGLDVEVYDPRKDAALVKMYDENSFKEGKLLAKNALYKELGLVVKEEEEQFLVGFVGRIAEQKNIPLMDTSLRTILKNQRNRGIIRFVFLGVGDKPLEDLLHSLQSEYPENVIFANQFDESLAHRFFAASDMFLIPSLFEPCGLTQLIAMRYGALPLATKVGGLVDTISENNNRTGFFIREPDPTFVSVQILDLYTLWSNDRETWDKIVVNGMTRDFSWKESAKKYIEVYGK